MLQSSLDHTKLEVVQMPMLLASPVKCNLVVPLQLMAVGCGFHHHNEQAKGLHPLCLRRNERKQCHLMDEDNFN